MSVAYNSVVRRRTGDVKIVCGVWRVPKEQWTVITDILI